MEYFATEKQEGTAPGGGLEATERLLYGKLRRAIEDDKPDRAREWVLVMQRLGIV